MDKGKGRQTTHLTALHGCTTYSTKRWSQAFINHIQEIWIFQSCCHPLFIIQLFVHCKENRKMRKALRSGCKFEKFCIVWASKNMLMRLATSGKHITSSSLQNAGPNDTSRRPALFVIQRHKQNLWTTKWLHKFLQKLRCFKSVDYTRVKISSMAFYLRVRFKHDCFNKHSKRIMSSEDLDPGTMSRLALTC